RSSRCLNLLAGESHVSSHALTISELPITVWKNDSSGINISSETVGSSFHGMTFKLSSIAPRILDRVTAYWPRQSTNGTFMPLEQSSSRIPEGLLSSRLNLELVGSPGRLGTVETSLIVVSPSARSGDVS